MLCVEFHGFAFKLAYAASLNRYYFTASLLLQNPLEGFFVAILLAVALFVCIGGNFNGCVVWRLRVITVEGLKCFFHRSFSVTRFIICPVLCNYVK